MTCGHARLCEACIMRVSVMDGEIDQLINQSLFHSALKRIPES